MLYTFHNDETCIKIAFWYIIYIYTPVINLWSKELHVEKRRSIGRAYRNKKNIKRDNAVQLENPEKNFPH